MSFVFDGVFIMNLRLSVLAAVAVVSLAGVGVGQVAAPVNEAVRPAPSVGAAQSVGADQVITRNTFRDVAKKVTPAVVNIKVRSNIVLGAIGRVPSRPGTSREMREYMEELLERERWGKSPDFGEDYKYARSGSGVLVRGDGYVVTSLHVIEDVDSEDIEISMPDGRTFTDVELIGTDKLTDLAVVKINDAGTSDLPHLDWADSDAVQVGDHVVAVGNPLDFTNSVSEGIVSAKHRTINKAALEDLLQTTAMINPGNSGGALVDLDGSLVGINMAIATSTGMWSGLGFAVPSKTARAVTDQIINKGKASRGYLGIEMRPLTIGIAEQLGYEGSNGIIVVDITPGTAAEKAGLQHYDIIAAVNGNRIETYSDMHRNIGNLTSGTSVTLEVWRDDGAGKLEKLTKDVVLGERPDDRELQAGTGSSRPSLPGTRPNDQLLGMKLEPAEDGKGLLVKEVSPKSATEKADVSPGDIIREVNRKSVTTVDDFKDAVKASNKGSHLLYIEREGTALLQVVPGD